MPSSHSRRDSRRVTRSARDQVPPPPRTGRWRRWLNVLLIGLLGLLFLGPCVMGIVAYTVYLHARDRGRKVSDAARQKRDQTGARAREHGLSAGGSTQPSTRPKLALVPVTEAVSNLSSSDPVAKRLAVRLLASRPPTAAERDQVPMVARQLVVMAADREDAGLATDSMQALGSWYDPSIVPELVGIMNHSPRQELRRSAVEILGRIGSPKAGNALAEALQSMITREAAAEALVQLGPAVEKPVLAMINDPSWLVRREACRILAQIGTPAGRGALMQCSDHDRIGFVRREAERALRQINRRHAPAVQVQSASAEQGILVLADDLSASDRATRLHAMEKLAKAPVLPEARSHVFKALQASVDPSDIPWTLLVIDQLTRWGGREAVKPLMDLAGRSGRELKKASFVKLGQLRAPEAVQLMTRHLPDPLMRDVSIQSLVMIGSPAEAEVAKLLQVNDWQVRRVACDILTQIGTHRSAAALESATRDPVSMVRQSAQTALSAVRQREP